MYYINENQAIVFRILEIPSMLSWVDEGEYMEVKLIDFDNNTVIDLTPDQVKKYYKQVTGRDSRISYWREMKYMNYLKSDECAQNQLEYARSQVR